MLALPLPPLSDGELSLWPWQVDDAEELVRAWSDPAVIFSTTVPEDRSVVAARHWIVGDEQRRRAGTALDLVIVERDQVAGEIGLSEFRDDGRAALVGYWLHEQFRGRGLATRALILFVEWALTPGALTEAGLQMVVARCRPDNVESHGVCGRAGFEYARDDTAGNRLYIKKGSDI